MQYVITTTLPWEFGGRTKALLKRTKLLTEKAGLDYTIITTNYHPDYNEIYARYYKKRYVPEAVRLVNIYDFLAKRSYHKSEVHQQIDEKGLTKYEVEKDTIYRYFDNGHYVLYKNFDPSHNKLKFIDIMDPFTRKRKIRKEYNRKGLCHKELIYKQGTTNVIEEIFYNEDGKAYLNKTYNGGADQKLIRIYHFADFQVREFQTEKEFIRYCFELMIEPHSSVICDARFLDRPLIEMDVSDVKRVFIFHNSHLNSERTDDVKSSYRFLIDQYDKADAIVVLTAQQKQDLSRLTKDGGKIFVIPHSIAIKSPEAIPKKRDNKFVYIGRLAPEKQVDHIIEAFRLKEKELKDVQLEIYGTGSEENRLSQLISTYGLEEKIVLKGTTQDPEGIFAKAKASFLTSQYEGFGLVILESLNNGCPVIAYDVKYGPTDMIRHGENGYLIERDNILALADAMVALLDKTFPPINTDSRFSEEAFLEAWETILRTSRKTKLLGKLFKRLQ